MSWADEINKLFSCGDPDKPAIIISRSTSDDKTIVRNYLDAEGRYIMESIPTEALKEYNRLLENMQRMGIKHIRELGSFRR